MLSRFNPAAGNYALGSHSLLSFGPSGMERRNGQKEKLMC